MTGEYAVELFVRDAPMDRETVRFHLVNNYATLISDYNFTHALLANANRIKNGAKQ